MFVAVLAFLEGLTEAPGGALCQPGPELPREIRISKGDAALSVLPTMASKPWRAGGGGVLFHPKTRGHPSLGAA